ncbi:MAG TPA: sigma factor-like helix-turn-helix DNA-binding protein [Stellaceae bacterium]|nr:sigma factor-like helix-turn-helix DNA-binding protein [Stellaceae bacterium]
MIKVERLERASPDSRAIRSKVRHLEHAMNCLPDEQRTVLVLIGLEGMGCEEVARICAVPVNVVQSRLDCAQRRVRQILTEQNFGSLR